MIDDLSTVLIAVISVEKVVRACAMLHTFIPYGLNMTAARSPAGTCFRHPQFPGAQACACTDREACNDSPFIGKNVDGQFLASKERPDDTGKLPADTTTTSSGASSGSGTDTTKAPADGSVSNTNIISDPAASGNANNDASAAEDKNKKSAADSGNSTGGNLGSTGGSHCLRGSFASCIVLLYLSTYSPVVNRIAS